MSAFTILQKKGPHSSFKATRNACKLCAPLGASLVIRGVEGALPYLHGSQGCATYMRRYIISHFREPMDIAASNFSEASTIFGGAEVFSKGIANVAKSYQPSMIGIATTCLTETIGEDLELLLSRVKTGENADKLPELIPISTPSYRGTHMDGFHAAVLSIVERLAGKDQAGAERLNLFPGMVSTADLRYLKEIAEDFGIEVALLPDYSETLEGPLQDEYLKIPEGGVPIKTIRSMGSAKASVEFGRTIQRGTTAASYLQKEFGVAAHRIGTPIGVRETDLFFEHLEKITQRPAPRKYAKERGRLIDSYVDGHKYVFGKRAVVYGEEDFVIGLTAFLAEIGVQPVLCGSGGESGRLAESIAAVAPNLAGKILIREGTDFLSMEETARELKPDLLIGSSKGQHMARHLNAPLLRVGFPIHDRIGGQRILHIGYRGAQQLFDLIVNTFLERKQNDSPIGYSYQ
jgi:nitrogenase molybdenum-iron protein NifN